MNRSELFNIKYEIFKSIDFSLDMKKLEYNSIIYKGMNILADHVYITKDHNKNRVNVSFKYAEELIVNDNLHNLSDNIKILHDLENKRLMFVAE